MKKQQFKTRQIQLFSRDLAVDLGTTYTVIWSPQKGKLLHEPSVLAVDTRHNSVNNSGWGAFKMIGKAPPYIEVIQPLQEGVIASFNYTVKMLNSFLDQVIYRSPLIKYRLIMTVPYSSTQVERQAMITAGKRLGLKKIFLIEEPLAAAMGAKLPIDEARGNFIINMGGGVTEIAVISLGGIVKAKSLRQGGRSLDRAIQRFLHKKYRLEIGESTASRTREEAGYALEPPEEFYSLKGVNRNTRRPDRLSIAMSEITEAMQPVLSAYSAAAKRIFEQTPPQLTSDIMKDGIYLTGGGSLLKNMDKLLSHKLQLPVKQVEDPLTSSARGAGQALHYMRSHRLDLYRA